MNQDTDIMDRTITWGSLELTIREVVAYDDALEELVASKMPPDPADVFMISPSSFRSVVVSSFVAGLMSGRGGVPDGKEVAIKATAAAYSARAHAVSCRDRLPLPLLIDVFSAFTGKE